MNIGASDKPAVFETGGVFLQSLHALRFPWQHTDLINPFPDTVAAQQFDLPDLSDAVLQSEFIGSDLKVVDVSRALQLRYRDFGQIIAKNTLFARGDDIVELLKDSAVNIELELTHPFQVGFTIDDILPEPGTLENLQVTGMARSCKRLESFVRKQLAARSQQQAA